MSIASEIQALNTNLTSAKNAVTAKGGTVGDTGLAGLADEIASIPTGGVPEYWATLTYLDDNDVEKTIDLTPENFYQLTTAPEIYDFDGTSVRKNKITKVEVTEGVEELPTSFLEGDSFSILTTVILPDTIEIIENNVFRYNNKITSPLNLSNVRYIGNNFFASVSNAVYNQPLNLSKIKHIGDSFLSSQSNFNSSITLNDDCTYIGGSFMLGCSSFNQNISIPSQCSYIGASFLWIANNFCSTVVCNSPTIPVDTNNRTLATSSSSALIYSTGVTLTGTYASDWKTALPDRTSSPYRKLILG